MRVERISVSGIAIGQRHRKIVDSKVLELAESMARLGLLQPITVYTPDDATVNLVAGLHRLEAAKKLEWEEIDAIFIDGDDVDRELAEIAENLHRAELTTLERDEQVARWIELVEAKRQEPAETKPAQPAPVSKVGGRGRKSGVNLASRELGIERTDAQRAVKVASLSPEAKEAARELGLDDNRSALLKAAKAESPTAQVESLEARAYADAAEGPSKADADCRRIQAAWNAASGDGRALFLARNHLAEQEPA